MYLELNPSQPGVAFLYPLKTATPGCNGLTDRTSILREILICLRVKLVKKYNICISKDLVISFAGLLKTENSYGFRVGYPKIHFKPFRPDLGQREKN